MAFFMFTVFFSAQTEPFYDFYGPFCKTSAEKGGSKMGPKDYIIFSLQYLCPYIIANESSSCGLSQGSSKQQNLALKVRKMKNQFLSIFHNSRVIFHRFSPRNTRKRPNLAKSSSFAGFSVIVSP